MAEEEAKVEATPFEKFEGVARRVFSAPKRKSVEHIRSKDKRQQAMVSRANRKTDTV